MLKETAAEPIGQHPHQGGSQPPLGLPARVHAPVLVTNCHIASAELFFPSTLRTLCCNLRALSRYLPSLRTVLTARWMFEAFHLWAGMRMPAPFAATLSRLTCCSSCIATPTMGVPHASAVCTVPCPPWLTSLGYAASRKKSGATCTKCLSPPSTLTSSVPSPGFVMRRLPSPMIRRTFSTVV